METNGIYELLKEHGASDIGNPLDSVHGDILEEKIAKIMGMAEQTVYTKRNRLRKKIKKFIEKLNNNSIFRRLFNRQVNFASVL